MDFLAQYGLFVLKAFTLVVALLLALAGILALSRKPKPRLEIISLNKHYESTQQQMTLAIKNEKLKIAKKKKKKEDKNKPSLFVIDFYGDMKASQVEELRDAVNAVLSVVGEKDEVMIRIESPGGAVNGYGLAASQLQRIRDRNIPLTACVDRIAASGGYLMACVANQILAAPFAIIGSIGVVAQIPNFHRWLQKQNIDVELLTAGEYKRTLTLFGENTEKGRQKVLEELEKIHQAFRSYVISNREQLDMDKVGTGEHWLATDAFELKLVDSLKTSDDYLIEKMKDYKAFKIAVHSRKSLMTKLSQSFAKDFLLKIKKPTIEFL